MSNKNGKTPKPLFNLGGGQAEADPILADSFFETSEYLSLSHRDDHMSFVVGRTGVGKSAILQRIEEVNHGHVIRISPEDLSLPYISNTTAVRDLKSEGVDLMPFFTALWKHVFLVEIIRHRYSIKDKRAQQTILDSLRSKINNDPSKKAALDYLNEFQDRFWCETHERVREIADKFETNLSGSASTGNYLPVEIGASGHANHSREVRSELSQRHQKYVNETQLPRLNKMMSVVDEDILESPQNFTWLIIDDLDRNWVEEPLLKDLILCLFRTVVDFKRVQNLKVLVALRTNLFAQLDFASVHGIQEEKFRDLTVHLNWTEGELEQMLDERVRAAAVRSGKQGANRLEDILPKANTSRGNPSKYLLNHTLLRPRDAISFLNESLRASGNKTPLTWDEISGGELSYSHNRLIALRDEWKNVYPDLDHVISKFSGAPALMFPDVFIKYLSDVSYLLTEAKFSDTWLMEALRPVWEGSEDGDVEDLVLYKPLISILYEVGFIGIRTATSKGIFSYDNPDLMRYNHAFLNVEKFVIHPMFWRAIDIDIQPTGYREQ